MHAILGLAATHLTAVANADYKLVGIRHRILAIKGFQEALAKTPSQAADSDALLAACYSLTFQSSFMDDGFAEFLTMVRGCVIISQQMNHPRFTYFFAIHPESHREYMEPRLQNLETLDQSLTDGAAESLENLRFLSEDATNSLFYNTLVRIVNGLRISTRLGKKKDLYKPDKLAHFSESRLLLLHRGI
jgi:hypothetical protein